MAFVYWIHLPEHTDMFSQGYIGFTSKTIESRYKQHIKDSLKNPDFVLYRAMSKYGANNLIVSCVLEGSNEYCLDIEYKLRPLRNTGWNTIKGGGKGWLGNSHSESSRLLMSTSKKGKKLSDSHCNNISINSPKLWLGVKPWEHTTSKTEVWISAIELFALYKSVNGCGDRKLAKLSNKFSRNCLQTIISKFRCGWIPDQDNEYVKWLNTKNKECYGT